MGYTDTRPYDPARLPAKVISDSQVSNYQYNRSWCSEQFRRRGKCGKPVIEAWMPSKKRSPGDAGGRWWVLCQFHAEARGVLDGPPADPGHLPRAGASPASARPGAADQRHDLHPVAAAADQAGAG